MTKLFVVKTGSSTSDHEGQTIKSDRIDFTSIVDHKVIRDFAMIGLDDLAREYYLPRVEAVLDGKKTSIQINDNKFIVRCELCSNSMLQIYEIVKTIKES